MNILHWLLTREIITEMEYEKLKQEYRTKNCFEKTNIQIHPTVEYRTPNTIITASLIPKF